MNGKGSKARPFSVDFGEFAEKFDAAMINPRDLYRQAVIQPDFSERYPELTGNWGEDRDQWLRILTFGGR